MKKYFMFVAVAAAGMLASCSSESLTGSDPTIEPGQEDLVPIKINVASPSARAITRGTGTVGGIVKETGTDTYVPANNDGSEAGAVANSWAGQKINVYMLKKGTLDVAKFNSDDIYKNAQLTTPAGEAEGEAKYHAGGAATHNYIKYYPQTGQYDFWGYRIDDAVTAAAPAVDAETNTLKVGITVDGTQDVLGAKTKDPNLSGTTLTTADLYSAKAARQAIQPTLDFKHLMTRLTFEAFAGNLDAESVTITSIEVRPIKSITQQGAEPAAGDTTYIKPTGTLLIAGTAPAFEQKVNWDQTTTDFSQAPWLTLKKRPSGDPNDALVALTDIALTGTFNATTPYSESNPESKAKIGIGEAIIAPDAKFYELKIGLKQRVKKYEDSNPAEDDDMEDYSFSTIKTVVSSEANFRIGYSYDFIIKVFGLEKIQINTILSPWMWKENISVVTE